MLCLLALYFEISESKKKVLFSDVCEVRKGTSSISIPLQHTVALMGDIRVDFFNRPKMKRQVHTSARNTLSIYFWHDKLINHFHTFQEKMFHFWFNTFFVREKTNSEYDNGELPVERSGRALSCDGTAMELSTVMSHVKPRTGSLASLGPMPPTLVLRIDKSGLDDAHKDKNHKVYSPDFKVSSFPHVY